MTCSGSRIIPLQSGFKRFQWTFKLAPVSVPILGADFLRHHHLLVNLAGGLLFEPSDPLPPDESLPTASAPASQEFPLSANLLSSPQSIQDLFHEFSNEVYSDRLAAAKPRHNIHHHILTNPGPPLFAKLFRLYPEKLASAEEEFSVLEKAGIIRHSNSSWSSPLHMVKKKDGRWCPCGDYRRLNTATIPDHYPLLNILDFTSRISGSTVFSKLDLHKGYYQVPMNKDDIQKTAIIMPFGTFEFSAFPLDSGMPGTPSRG